MSNCQCQTAWERFLSTGEIDTRVIKPVIAESWLRCRQHGVDPQGGSSSVVATGKELERLLAQNQELIETARPFMQNLYKLVASSGFIVSLADKNGFLLEVIGDTEILESNRGMHYVRGVKWTENLVGTTAIALTLLGYGPIQVVGAEHYCREHQGWACSAAPLTDAAGNFSGVLSVTGQKSQVHCHTLGMVVSAAEAINNMCRVRKTQRALEESARVHSTIVNSMSDGLLVLDKNGIVTFINPAGARILQINAAEAVGKHLGDLVEFRPKVLKVLETGQGYTDKEFFIETKRGVLHFVKTAIPLRDKEGRLEGVIDIFREIKRVRRLVNQMVGATAQFTFEDIIGTSPAIRECIRLGKIAANSTANVLIQGESGTGKELVAQAIHNSSSRCEGPFVAINCGALPRNLVESELFGYEEGAFTGAGHGGRPGKFEMAHGGTIFLDEIGEMPLDIQVKLLRVLQAKRITRVGGQQYLDVDVRVIAATNRDLTAEIKEGNFRPDLYYRLNVLPIFVPPLRERQGDILLLVNFFLNKMCRQLGLPAKQFAPEALNMLVEYDWPGNVRELENVVERAVNICEAAEITPEYLPRTITDRPVSGSRGQNSLKEMERRMIEDMLQKTSGNITSAAKLLGIGRNTLYSKLREYGIAQTKRRVLNIRTTVVQ